MMRTSLPRLCGNISLILICAVLGACGSMQKSSSSSAGEQSAAPISEAPQPGDKSSAAKAASSASGDAGSSASSKPAGNSDVTGKPIAADASADNSEASQLKRQLDEQDAQINRLRNEQQAEEARLDAEQRMQEQQQAAGTGAGSQGKPAANDEAAVFPAGDNSASPAGTAAANAAAAAAADKASAIAPAATERSVYFAYNEAIVAEKYDDMLLANAAYLRAHPNFTAEVQGNCDDRGSREYNLALGARRAEAVKRALELAGANGSRITAVSYGAEKPVASGKDEESYRKNRRVDILY
jgi:peptidoglycan-associated lipoprotein